MSLVLGGILFLQHLHVLFDIHTEDLIFVCLGIILGVCALLLSRLEAREVLGTVGNVQTAICCTLQCAPHACTHTCSSNTYIQNDLEWPLLCLFFFDVVLFAVNLFLALDHTVLAEFLQGAACDEETGAICSSVVLVSHWNAVLGKFSRCGLANNLISCDGSVGNLADDFPVGEAHDEPVLLVVVLVLVLTNHLTARLEVSLAFAATALLNL